MGISPDVTEASIIVGLEAFDRFPDVKRFLKERRGQSREGYGIWYSGDVALALLNVGKQLGDVEACACAVRLAETPVGRLEMVLRDLKQPGQDRVRESYQRFISGQY